MWIFTPQKFDKSAQKISNINQLAQYKKIVHYAVKIGPTVYEIEFCPVKNLIQR